MKLHEALTAPEVLSGDMWIRPADWYASPVAFVVKMGAIYAVPSGRGGELGITPSARLLAGEWDIVTPRFVLEGF